MCRTTNIDLLNKNEEVLFSRFHDKWHVACFQGLCINDQTKQPKWRFLLIRRFSLRSNQSELKPLQIFTPSCQVLNHQNDASFNLRTSIILELKNAVLLDLHALDLIVCWSPWHWEYVMRTETRGQTATGSQIVPISQTCSVLQHQCVFILLRVAKKDTVTMRVGLSLVNSPPLLSSVSMGCFSAVMSLKVRRNRTTRSRSFFIGAIWSSSHNGVSGTTRAYIKGKYVPRTGLMTGHCIKMADQ